MTTWMYFPTTIAYGPGALAEVPELLRGLAAKRPLIVTDRGVEAAGLLERLAGAIRGAGLPFSVFADVQPDPTERDVLRGVEAYRTAGADAIVALGGGSPLDCAKAIRLLANHAPPIERYDDRSGGGAHVTAPLPPLVAIPTTAGTGSEVSRSAVITLERGEKIIVFSPRLIPSAAVCDPELTVGLPPKLTAATGMDALSHNLEAYFASGLHPLADAIAIDGVGRVARALSRVLERPTDLEARGEMMVAAIQGAVAFQKGLGATHSMAHALTPIAGLHHGYANGICLPFVFAFNAEVAPDRAAQLGVALGARTSGGDEARIAEGLERLRALRKQVGIPDTLAEAGVDAGLIERLIERSTLDGSHRTNPRSCGAAEFRQLYAQAFGHSQPARAQSSRAIVSSASR